MAGVANASPRLVRFENRMKMIHAKRKDGSPAQIGDTVLVVWDNGRKQFGKIGSINKAKRFSSKKNALLAVYSIRCSDGTSRPAHAWHIKFIKV